MHPTFSLILFTSMAGMAQGAIVSLAVLNSGSEQLPSELLNIYLFPLILALLIGGLLASTFHLGLSRHDLPVHSFYTGMGASNHHG